MKWLTIVFLVLSMLSGCGVMKNESEFFDVHGKTSWTMDNIGIRAPKGYFINGYEWVDVDENTLRLIITLTDDKEYGEK